MNQQELKPVGQSWWMWPVVAVLSFFLMAYANCSSYEPTAAEMEKVGQ